jgi:hypothetical protein
MWNTRYSCLILIKLQFSRQICEKTQTSDFIKICPVGVEFFHVDRQKDGHDEANSQSLFAILRKVTDY